MDIRRLQKDIVKDWRRQNVANDIGGNCYCCSSQFRPQMMRSLANITEQKKGFVIIRRNSITVIPLLPTNQSIICVSCDTAVNAMIRDRTIKVLNVVIHRGQQTCFICQQQNDLQEISFDAKVRLYVETNKFINSRVRSCAIHLTEDGMIHYAFYSNIRVAARAVQLNADDGMRILNTLRNQAASPRSVIFKNENQFNPNEFYILTGISKLHFNDMFSTIENTRFHQRRCYKKDLICFLVKMRQGLSDAFLGVMFNYTTRQLVSQKIQTVRHLLMQHFVPLHLGVNSITRMQFIHRHVPQFHQVLYNEGQPEVAILYIDGTYVDIPKSAHFRILRQSYCLHKHKHLIKPVLVVAPDGYILDVHGPYFSDNLNNDASILIQEFQNQLAGIRNWLQDGDIFIVDRGYRDSLQFLTNIGIRHRMPPFLVQGQNQFTAEEANEARLVTKTRWIIEARNGHLKSKFKLFRGTIAIQHVTSVGDFFRIGCAMINAYSPPIEMEGANAGLALEMLERAEEPNVLQAYLDTTNLRRRTGGWMDHDSQDLPNFPQLTLQQLRDLTFGVYQLKLSKSYTHDKVQAEQEFEFQMRLDEPGLLATRFRSRFSNSVRHRAWISFPEVWEEHENHEDMNEILGYYCDCKTGARTLGCCGHVAAVLWYLCYARHLPTVPTPASGPLRELGDAGNRPTIEIVIPTL